MKHIIEQLQKSVEPMTEAASQNKVWWDFLLQAEYDFLSGAVAGIKKIAGSHAKKVGVERSRNTVWLEYEGENRSDMEFEFMVVMTTREINKCGLYYSWKSADRGTGSKDAEYYAGEATPNVIVQMFAEVFGAGM